MKKYVVGIIIGAFLMFSGQAFADSISRIGKKVGSEATVYLNDKQLPDAIIVDSKSYAPVRDIAEAFGAEVEFEPASQGKKAVINLQGETIVHPPDLQLIILKQEKEQLEEELGRMEQTYKNSLKYIEEAQAKLDSTQMDWEKPVYQSRIESYTVSKVESETRIKEISKRLSEINEEISEL